MRCTVNFNGNWELCKYRTDTHGEVEVQGKDEKNQEQAGIVGQGSVIIRINLHNLLEAHCTVFSGSQIVVLTIRHRKLPDQFELYPNVELVFLSFYETGREFTLNKKHKF